VRVPGIAGELVALTVALLVCGFLLRGGRAARA
jgi:hypothetical protein